MIREVYYDMLSTSGFTYLTKILIIGFNTLAGIDFIMVIIILTVSKNIKVSFDDSEINK